MSEFFCVFFFLQRINEASAATVTTTTTAATTEITPHFWTRPMQQSPAGSPSRGGDVAVYVFDRNQPSFSTPFYSVFVSTSLSYGPFSCISFLKFSRQLSAFPLCSSGLISALLVLSTTYLFMKVSFSPDVILCVWLGLKHQLINWLTDWLTHWLTDWLTHSLTHSMQQRTGNF